MVEIPVGGSKPTGKPSRLKPAVTLAVDLLDQVIANSRPLVPAEDPYILRKLWLLREEEINAIADPAARLLEKVLPAKTKQVIERANPAAELLAALIPIVGSRLAYERDIKRQLGLTTEGVRKNEETMGSRAAGGSNGAPKAGANAAAEAAEGGSGAAADARSLLRRSLNNSTYGGFPYGRP